MSCDTTAFVGAQNRKKIFTTLVTWCGFVHNPTSNWYAKTGATFINSETASDASGHTKK